MIVKVKFSKFANFDEEYMSSQREYTFKTKADLKKGYIIYGKEYHKFLHITETMDDVDSEYYTPSIEKATKTPFNEESFKLKELIETEDIIHDELKIPVFNVQ